MQAIINGATPSFITQIFNLSKQLLEDLITVWEFELQCSDVQLQNKHHLHQDAYKSDYRELFLFNLAVNHYNL